MTSVDPRSQDNQSLFHVAADDRAWASFLIDFVVESTGYPPEMVELDADLEADLGIDSIKKAQLFGEIGERFQVEGNPSMSLDDFPTLRHVLDYIRQAKGAHDQPATANGAAHGADSIAAGAHGAGHGSTSNGATAGLATYNGPAAGADSAAGRQASANPPDDRAFESFLIDFVVESTGYPAEMVELDADLEADLGIDSIKKAQLFGEIGERFQVEGDPSMSLDDFPTLRHVLAYIRKAKGTVVDASPTLKESILQAPPTAAYRSSRTYRAGRNARPRQKRVRRIARAAGYCGDRLRGVAARAGSAGGACGRTIGSCRRRRER